MAAPAMADLAVVFDFTGMHLAYNAGSGQMTITKTNNSTANVTLNDVTAIDSAYIIPVFAGPPTNALLPSQFLATSSMTVTGSNGNYAINGLFSATDTNMGSSAILANFQSKSVEISAQGDLTIYGSLATVTGNDSILVNRGTNNWVYQGMYGDAADQDGNNGTITVANPNAFDSGEMWQLLFKTNITGGTDASRLDTFFAANRVADSGNVKGVIVPAPDAVVLGFAGLTAVGLWMRKRTEIA